VKMLSTKDLMGMLEVSRRTVSNWVKRGLPARRFKVGNRKELRFRVEDVEDWVLANVQNGADILARAVGKEKPGAANDGNDGSGAGGKDEAAGRTGKGVKPTGRKGRRRGRPRKKKEAEAAEVELTEERKALEETGDHELAQMVARIRAGEKLTHLEWLAAVDENRRARERGEKLVHSASALQLLERNWHANVEARRKLEKDLPEILLKKGRYVDVTKVGKVLADAGRQMATHLDQLPESVAVDCEGKDAKAIVKILTHELNEARAAVAQVLNEYCGVTG